MTYQDIAKEYRSIYRERYMAATLIAGHLEDGKYTKGVSWGPIKIPLFNKNNNDLANSYIIIDFQENLEPHGENGLFAMNNITHDPNGNLIGTIHVDKRLYGDYIASDSERATEFRKCILAHEWLEVVHAIKTGGRVRPRKVAGNISRIAFAASLDRPIPWEDDLDERDLLRIGLRELLVSGHTIEKQIEDDEVLKPAGVTTPDQLVNHLRALGPDSTAVKNFIGQLACRIAGKIKVSHKLIETRLYEFIGI